jgi:hypothetical protein
LTAILIVIGLACTAATAQRGLRVIDHVYPKPDSTGAVPTRFEWTSIEGTEEYVITLWNDADVLLWRQYVTGTSVPWPKPLQIEEGTYFWIVGAIRGGELIGDSGRAAFVVMNTR